jgi:alkylation response protein AidB-like acyl-CoA dehydrogenase
VRLEATIIGAHAQLCGMSIFLSGNEDQKDRYLRALCEGSKLGAWALTEPGAGSDAAHISTTATRQGDDWVLNGSKMWITNGSFADVLVVFCATDRELGARGGITAFIVEKDFPGFRVGKVEDKMGLRASHTASLYFEDCRVPAANVLGPLGGGFPIAMQTQDIGRCALGASSLARPRRPTSWRFAMPPSASSSAARSPTSRPSSSSWPTWRSRSTPWSRSSTTARKRSTAMRVRRSSRASSSFTAPRWPRR